MVELKAIKSADRSYVFLGISNRIKYSIVITNIGDEKANCVKVRDVMSRGAHFVPGTFMINGCEQEIFNINSEISIGSIKPGSNILVSFDVEVISCNPPTEIKNKAIVTYCDSENNILVTESQEVTIPVINISITMKKMVDKCIAKIGEVLSYSVFIRNNSNISIDNVVFYDALSPSLELLPASVLINLQPQYVDNLNEGLNLGTINSYSSVIISFQAQIVSLPDPALIKNTGRIEFTYTILDSGIPITSLGQGCSNEVVTRVCNETWTC